MKYFVVFFVVAVATVVVIAQEPEERSEEPTTLENSDVDPASAETSPLEVTRDKRGFFGVYRPAPYFYGGYKSYYKSPIPYYSVYPYYGFRKFYGFY